MPASPSEGRRCEGGACVCQAQQTLRACHAPHTSTNTCTALCACGVFLTFWSCSRVRSGMKARCLPEHMHCSSVLWD